MAFPSSILEAEPFEESQGQAPVLPTPDDYKAFYSDMEKQETLQRRLSRNKSGSRSIWSRKSLKKTSVQLAAGNISSANQPKSGGQLYMDEVKEKMEEALKGAATSMTSLPLSSSIIPEPLKNMPAWYNKEEVTTVPAYRVKYPIHNPFGPRWYRNMHLVPSSSLRPPPSVFSPSFPSFPSAHERSEDYSRAAGPSRTPSGTPLPTPTSSQTGIAEYGGKPRSRKTSQTDPVDLLDVTDPWGTSWHHHSPYDPIHSDSAAPDPPEGSQQRPWVENPTVSQSRHKAITPSPLSQSTSVVHLQPPDANRTTRRLSKRSKIVLENSNAEGSITGPQVTSLPTTPVDLIPSSWKGDDFQRRRISRPYSSLPPPTTNTLLVPPTEPKRGKRSSVLGRLVKTFSLLKRNSHDPGHGSGPTGDEFLRPLGEGLQPSGGMRLSVPPPNPNQLAEQRNSADLSKRVPPPPPESSQNAVPETRIEEPLDNVDDRSSASLSVEAPVSTGKLTIANPDSPPAEDTNTPIQRDLPEVAPTPPPERPTPPPERPTPPPERPTPSKDDLPASSPVVTQPTYPVFQQSSPAQPQPAPRNDFAMSLSPPRSAEAPPSDSHGVQSSQSHSGAAPSNSSAPIPFPKVSDGPLPEIPSSRLSNIFSGFPSSIVDSPLSTASSLFVHPPTPHVPVRPIDNDKPVPPMPSVQPPTDTRWSPQEPAFVRPNISSVSRQTETFKLVRSVSGTIEKPGETIIAAGQQWEIVESDNPRRSKTREKSTKSKERDGSRKEHNKRLEKPWVDSTEYGTGDGRSGQAQQRLSNGRPVDPSASLLSIPSEFRVRSDRHRGSSASINPDDYRQSRRREDERDRSSDRRNNEGETLLSNVNVNKPQPPPPPPTPGPAQVERRLSTTNRPTSELPSAAELNALRAKDAWDMERLWKGRSMYEAEPKEVPSPMLAGMSVEHLAGTRNTGESMHAANYGSSHTSIIVQTPFNGHAVYPNMYHSMPAPPPPIIYSAANSHHFSPMQGYPANFLPPSFPAPDHSSASPLARPLTNPLPEPPRQSSYEPPPLPPTLNPGSGPTADYWTKYTSVTTAH